MTDYNSTYKNGSGCYKDGCEASVSTTMKIREGVDVLPAHDMLEDFTELLLQRERFEEDMGDEFDRYAQLHRVLWQENQIHEDYDVILIDPNARAENTLFNAIYATRTLIAPTKPAGKGSKSLDGLDDLLGGMADDLGIDVGVAAVILSGVSDTSTHQRYVKEIEDDYGVAASVRDRESMMDEMWDARGSAFRVVEEEWLDGSPGERGVRDREVDTLGSVIEIADHVADEFGVEPPKQPRIDIEAIQ